jgi:hypothetical protein
MLQFVSGPCAMRVDLDVFSFTAGAGDRVSAATLAGFGGCRVDTLIDVIVSDGTMVLQTDDRDRVIESVSSPGDSVRVVVDMGRERVAPQWCVINGLGAFSGSFFVNCNGSGRGGDAK